MSFTEDQLTRISSELAILTLQRRIGNLNKPVPSPDSLREIDLYQDDKTVVHNFLCHFADIREELKRQSEEME